MAIVELILPHHRYEIVIEPGSLASLGERVRHLAPHHRAALVLDRHIEALYGEETNRSMVKAGYAVSQATIPPGEERKNLDTVRSLYELLVDTRLERRSPIVALGGGVVGDTAGFVAATYLRGTPFFQCPTTLLAMVDSSVGGKVGVNLPQGKNLIGSFYQPNLVVIDTDTLNSLPSRELQCGLAECVKHGMIRDASLFEWIDNHLDAILGLDRNALVELVRRNVEIKAKVVMADEKESSQRAELNFGHTFGHAIEATQAYDSEHGYHHGEAVALGMVAATRLAVETGRCLRNALDRISALLNRIGLPTSAPKLPPPDELVKVMRLDKKVEDDRMRLILPHEVGSVSIVSDVPVDAIHGAWQFIAGNGRGR